MNGVTDHLAKYFSITYKACSRVPFFLIRKEKFQKRAKLSLKILSNIIQDEHPDLTIGKAKSYKAPQKTDHWQDTVSGKFSTWPQVQMVVKTVYWASFLPSTVMYLISAQHIPSCKYTHTKLSCTRLFKISYQIGNRFSADAMFCDARPTKEGLGWHTEGSLYTQGRHVHAHDPGWLR